MELVLYGSKHSHNVDLYPLSVVAILEKYVHWLDTVYAESSLMN